MTKFIWHIYRTDGAGYDKYDSMVVVSESEEKARTYTPNEGIDWGNGKEDTPVVVTLIGIAVDGFTEGDIIIASYNAG